MKNSSSTSVLAVFLVSAGVCGVTACCWLFTAGLSATVPLFWLRLSAAAAAAACIVCIRFSLDY